MTTTWKERQCSSSYLKGNMFLVASRIGMELIRRIRRRIFFLYSPKTYSCGWISVKTSRHMPCPGLTADHRHLRRILLHPQQKCHYQHWSHVIFAEEPTSAPTTLIVMFHGCNNTLVFQQYDEALGHCHYSSKGWPWTHEQMSDKKSADGSYLVPVYQHVATMTMIEWWCVSLRHLSGCLECTFPWMKCMDFA